MAAFTLSRLAEVRAFGAKQVHVAIASVGYGVAAGGRVVLVAILASCAPGLSVVNIDNGFGTACAALRLLHAASRLSGERLKASTP